MGVRTAFFQLSSNGIRREHLLQARRLGQERHLLRILPVRGEKFVGRLRCTTGGSGIGVRIISGTAFHELDRTVRCNPAYRLMYPPLTKPPMITMVPSPRGSAAEYQRFFCMDKTAGLSNHWQLGEAKSSESVQGLRMRMDLAPSKSWYVASHEPDPPPAFFTEPISPPGPIAPFPPKVTKP